MAMEAHAGVHWCLYGSEQNVYVIVYRVCPAVECPVQYNVPKKCDVASVRRPQSYRLQDVSSNTPNLAWLLAWRH